MAGIKYWAQGVDKFGGNYLAGAAAYHDGPNSAAVARYAQTGDPSGLTAEGQDYINSISHMSRPGALVNGGAFPGTRNTLGDYPGGGNVSTSEVNIGTVVVRGDPNTAHGVAKGVRKALAQTGGFNQAYSGLN